MADKYYVYRPLLTLIGVSEGTLNHRGYNETLGYGKFTGGDVVLVDMTLGEIDKLQTKMLKHPDNNLNSSALGMYQIVQKTRRSIQKDLNISNDALFDGDMQDRMACYLLGVRGIDKWLAGRLSMNTLLTNLAKEWASLPMHTRMSYYGGKARVTVGEVKQALSLVKKRHEEGQPKVIVPKPVVPKEIDQTVRNKTNWLTTIFGAGGIGTAVLAYMKDADPVNVGIIAGGGILGAVLTLAAGEWIIRRIKAIRNAWEG